MLRTRMTRLATWPLIVALGLVLSADCIPIEQMTPIQKACCAAMGHDCGQGAVQADCCSTAAPQGYKFPVVKTAGLTAPDLSLVAVLAPSTPPAAARFALRNIANDAARKPPGVPAYVLTSAFRI